MWQQICLWCLMGLLAGQCGVWSCGQPYLGDWPQFRSGVAGIVVVQTRDGDTAVKLILGSFPSIISPGFQEPMGWPLWVQGPSSLLGPREGAQGALWMLPQRLGAHLFLASAQEILTKISFPLSCSFGNLSYGSHVQLCTWASSGLNNLIWSRAFGFAPLCLPGHTSVPLLFYLSLTALEAIHDRVERGIFVTLAYLLWGWL